MRTAILLALAAIAAGFCVQAQELRVVRHNGATDQFQLADIDSITFGAPAGLPAAGDVLRIHTSDGVVQLMVAAIDSVSFAGGHLMVVHQTSGAASQFALAQVDSVTFGSSGSGTVAIDFQGAAVIVDNPLADAGVAIAVTGADVVVTSTGVAGITYALSGATGDGMFKIYSTEDFALLLSGVQIVNQDGPAINIQADVTIDVTLADGTTSALTDGVTYASAPGEDQKAAFFSEGQLVFAGGGSLIIHGQGDNKHGLASDDYVEIRDGTIVVASAVRDGIHTNEGYWQLGGAIEVTSGGDGVDAGEGPLEISGGALTVHEQADGADALKCDSLILISGGDVHLTVAGNQAKGLQSPDAQLTGGAVTIATSGGVVLEPAELGYDPSYCTGIKVDNDVLLDGCALTITATGAAGRGVSSNGTITIVSGSVHITSSGGGGTYINETGVTDAYHGPCLNADGDIVLREGTVVLAHSGSGGKGIAGDAGLAIGSATTSPTLEITTTGPPISIGGSEYAEAKAVSVDGALTIASGTLTLRSADDALKSKYWIEINGGLINILQAVEGLESPNLFINGGEIHMTTTDDGINATYGVDGEFNDGSNLTINGGWVHVNAPTGDGIDSNGNLTINGGTVIVHGPPSQPEVGLDVNGTFRINGGFTIVSQINTNMVEVPSGTSTQRSVLLRRTQALPAGTLFHIEDTAGNSLVTFAPARSYSCILLSTANLIAGTTYRVYTGGTCTGTVRDGLYEGGTYSGGTLRATFTSSGTVQTVNF